jgi:Ser/Thr protein kinase RdoA (MazF antagonist)
MQNKKITDKQFSQDRAQVLKVLRDHYGVNHAELEFLAQGYSHKSYTFNAPIFGGKVLVKISHPGKSRPDEDICFEGVVTDFLIDHGYPVQTSYKSLNGNYFERSEDGRNIQVLKYLEEFREKRPNHKAKLIASGEFLNRFHRISKRFDVGRYRFGKGLIERRTFFIRKRLDALNSNLLMYQYIDKKHLKGSGLENNLDFLFGEYKKIRRVLNERRRNLFPKYLIHGDYNAGNIIFLKSDISGIIDFEHCAFGPFYWDIGFAIAHWSFIMNHYGVDRITRYFTRGYSRGNGRLSQTLVGAFRSFSSLWRLSDAIRYYPKYKSKTHWENEVRYYIKKCKMLRM